MTYRVTAPHPTPVVVFVVFLEFMIMSCGSPSFTNWVLSGISTLGETIPQPLGELPLWVAALPDFGLSTMFQKRPKTILRRKPMAGDSGRSPEEKGVSKAVRQLHT